MHIFTQVFWNLQTVIIEMYPQTTSDMFYISLWNFYSGGKDAILLDIEWPLSYPNVLPIISLDSFFNRLIMPNVKAEIVQVRE